VNLSSITSFNPRKFPFSRRFVFSVSISAGSITVDETVSRMSRIFPRGEDRTRVALSISFGDCSIGK